MSKNIGQKIFLNILMFYLEENFLIRNFQTCDMIKNPQSMRMFIVGLAVVLYVGKNELSISYKSTFARYLLFVHLFGGDTEKRTSQDNFALLNLTSFLYV